MPTSAHSMERVVRVHPSKTFHVLPDPVPHIIVDSNKQLHGWYSGKRECTAERLLVNPYNGCGNDCFCCYAKALPGYFQLFRKEGIITVFRDFGTSVSRQLDSLRVASCGYLSPVTDPFQSIDRTYRLSEKITRAFIERNVPIEFVTKSKVPDPVLDLMVQQSHSFCQFSFFTHREDMRLAFMKGGATCEQLFSEISRCRKRGLWVVCRIDPIIPKLTDARTDLEYLVRRAHDAGARHIVASVMDVPIRLRSEIWKHLENFGDGLVYDLQNLYSEKIDSTLHAKIEYRKRIFDWLRNCCDKLGMGFALCMEYELVDGVPRGLNKEFMNTVNCEGIDVPIYIRHGETERSLSQVQTVMAAA
ncbi:hypothetical protein AMJ40_03960 [candidate division TA06 bacterium DG_26]|uniref:Elp3/MiaA/NifB-like radical SAM core domain-containing protein n=1 Tax=candidate division TA06 bacterium DG_26 TaxID=1703771 RepID=A0A0S7WIU3_UNCT6|nr:MAG: hypothetical protein AMJ40_03960 [candidate division TA06 bacterium DG_26]